MIQHPGSCSDGGQLDLFVKQLGKVFQLLTSQQLSCSAAVSSGSAMGSMMQQFERELQYRCGGVSAMGSNTESSNAEDEGQRAKHQQHRSSTQDLVMLGVMYC